MALMITSSILLQLPYSPSLTLSSLYSLYSYTKVANVVIVAITHAGIVTHGRLRDNNYHRHVIPCTPPRIVHSGTTYYWIYLVSFTQLKSQ